jgi:tetratricopeptide (TPR) repeat protein/tRNA A-37 threonylcarbamoyl transferase component Bud32
MGPDGADAPTLIHPPGSATEDATLTDQEAVRRPRPRSHDTGPLRIGQDFGSRYHIIRLLGLGGMGAVYQAWDKELEIVVALKVIRPEAAADPETAQELDRRFKRELLLAREVTHKNVVRIHDLGELDGIKYITMSFVEGEDLHTVLEREGKLTVARTLRILRGIVAGLGAAHEAGVVHRDLKPANIMVSTSDEPVIMDFGIARTTGGGEPAVAALAAGADPSIGQRPNSNFGQTMAGAIVGTVAYMAPEQARGMVVDQRADQYALGLIVYDMLAGRRAAHARSALEELHRRLLSAPPPLRSLNAEVPEALEAIVSRCVAPDPKARFATTAELAAELDRLDAEGQPLPVPRRFTPRLLAAVAILVASLVGATWWLAASRGPVQTPDPISVLIADFANTTGDAAFDGTLEPTLTRALSEAGFITAYDRLRLPALGVERRDRLDAAAAREVAAQQGLAIVLSGSIEPRGAGYEVSIEAIQTVTGESIAAAEARARSKEEVPELVTRLVARVRRALGDARPESAQQFAMASISTTSLDVISLYAKAMEASSANRFEEARRNATRAVELDPEFGVGYLVMAVASGNLGAVADRDRYLEEALRHLDGMTERERYTTRGYSYWVSGDYEQCVKEYGDLIALYPADVGGRNQLALCLSNLRELRRAMEEIQAIVKILPSHVLFRDNLALYANYAGEFPLAEQTASGVEGPDAYATLALAFAQLGQGRIPDAKQTYERLGRIEGLGPSFAASGLGDLAAFEGRFSDAVDILRRGAAADLEAGMTAGAAAKLVALAHAEISRGRKAAAIAAAEEALGHNDAVKIRFLAARTLVEAGEAENARPLIESLAGELYAEPRAYAKILEGVVALQGEDPRRAVTLLREANDLFDTWIGLFDLGRASFAAGLYTQAEGAFDTCLNARRGEALSLFVDEEPTYSYLPAAYYWQGRAREEIGTAGFRESYDRYLQIRSGAGEDPLARDVRARIGTGRVSK